jgi:5'-3' exonuclease
MKDPNSPLREFFPDEFTIDMNGKINPWEGVVLIPFMDQQKLLEAVKSIDTSKLTESERKRSKNTSIILYLLI